MYSKTVVLNLKHFFWVMCLLFAALLIGCSGKPNFPDIDRLSKDLLSLIQKTTVNYGGGPQKLSDFYKLLRFEKTNGLQKRKGFYHIEFEGGVELLETVYNYGAYGYRTYRVPGKFDIISYNGKFNKGTVLFFTGSADYRLTEAGWRYDGHSISMESRRAPAF